MGWKTTIMVAFSLLAGPTIALGLGSQEHFSEALSFRPLRDGRVAARFSFKTVLKGAVPRSPESLGTDDIPQHYSLFPLSLGQILREYAVTELHLTLNSGKWDYVRWGYPEEAGVGTGAELWAWMGDGGSVSIDDRWKGLRNALAGLFCASLGSLDNLRTTSPAYSFKPEGSLPKYTSPHQLRHASLPSENVCTENLTPFLKLLPCKSSSGIASLLNPHSLFDADWHGMGIHVLWDKNEGVIIRLSFQAVFDPVRKSVVRQRDWSFSSLFGRSIGRGCPAAAEGLIQVSLPGEAYSISPEPSSVHEGVANYTMSDFSRGLDVTLRWPENAFSYPLEPPTTPLTDFSVVRTLTGASQSEGQLFVSITNNLPFNTQAIYLETLPWIVQFYLHTMRLTVNGESRDDLLSSLSYVPPIAHGRPMLFEPRLTLPAKSTLTITLEVSKSFLQYTEHPPDAQRGWNLPPAVLLPLRSNSTQGSQPRLQRIYTPTLLVDLATPDFSMPYNVIIMSSTLIALIFGSLFNLLTRNYVVLKAVGDTVVPAVAE